jgi:hypothetical protein
MNISTTEGFHYRGFASAGENKIREVTNYFGFSSRAKRRARGLKSPSYQG